MLFLPMTTRNVINLPIITRALRISERRSHRLAPSDILTINPLLTLIMFHTETFSSLLYQMSITREVAWEHLSDVDGEHT